MWRAMSLSEETQLWHRFQCLQHVMHNIWAHYEDVGHFLLKQALSSFPTLSPCYSSGCHYLLLRSFWDNLAALVTRKFGHSIHSLKVCTIQLERWIKSLTTKRQHKLVYMCLKLARLNSIMLLHFYFPGVGYGMEAFMWILGLYYNVIIAWAFYFLFAAMASVPPWSNCENSWNTITCMVGSDQKFLRLNDTALQIVLRGRHQSTIC